MEYKGKAAMFIESKFVGGGFSNFYPGRTIDYIKLVDHIEHRFGIKIHIKTIYMPRPEQNDATAFKFRDKLSYLGFSVNCDKETFHYKDSKTGETLKKCNFDSQISLEMHELALLGRTGIDYIVLFAADIDYFDILKKWVPASLCF